MLFVMENQFHSNQRHAVSYLLSYLCYYILLVFIFQKGSLIKIVRISDWGEDSAAAPLDESR